MKSTNNESLDNSTTDLEILRKHSSTWEMVYNIHRGFSYVSSACKSMSGYSDNEFIENQTLFFEIIIRI